MRRVALCLVALSLLLAGRAFAAAPWDKPFAGDPQKIIEAANRSTRDSTAHVVVLHEEARYSFDKKGRATVRLYRVYKVITQKGVNDWSHVSMSWAPWYQQRPSVRARVITPDGKVSKLDPKTLTISPAPESTHVYSDRRVVRGPIPAVAPHAVIEEEYVIRDTQPFFAPGSVYRFVLDMWVPVRKMLVTIDAPTSLRLRYEIRGSKTKPRVKKRGDRRTWRLVLGPSPAREAPESGLGPDAVRTPYIAFSTGRSWNHMARSYAHIIEQKLAAAGRPAAAFKTKEQDRLTIAKQALAYLHEHVRYTGLEFGQSSIVPWTPRETWQRKFGDCKDQATLLVSLLRQKGVKAYVALLSSGYGQDVRPDLPGMGAFNHAIVYLPGKTPIWIDPTDEFARAGELPVRDQNRWALVASPSSRRLVRTPKSTSRDNRAVEDRVIHLAEDGGSRVVETTRYYGAYDRENRGHYRRTDKKKLRENLEAYAKKEYLAKKLDRHHHSDLGDLSKPFQLTLEIGDATRAATYIDQAAVYIPLGNLTEYLPSILTKDDDKKKRQRPLILSTPHQKEWRYRIILPPGIVARHLPDNETLTFGPMVLSKAFSTRGKNVLAHFKFDTVKDRLTPQEVVRAREALKKFFDDTPVEINLQQQGYALVDEGKTKEGLAEYRRLIRLHPKEAVHRAQLSLALLRVGLREPARQQAQLAMRIEPKSYLGPAALAWILQHDRMGRHRAEGFEHRASVSAYRKAIALAPKEAFLKQDLAILLEHNEQGERYGDKARLEEAAALYQKAKAIDDAEDMDDNLILVLFRAKKFAKALSIAKAAKPNLLRNSLYIATTAALKGVPAAKRLMAKLPNAGASRHDVLESAASYLILVGHYESAAHMFREAARNAPSAARLHARADFLARTKRVDAKKQKRVNTPTGVVRHFFRVSFAGNLGANGLRSVFSAYLLKRAHPKNFKDTFKKSAISMRRQFTDSGMSIQTGMDLVHAMAEFKTEKIPRIGWKVSMEFAGVPSPFALVVRLEGKQHYIAGVLGEPESMGLGAQRALERGDLAKALAWLDLAAKSVSKERKLLSHKGAFHEVWRAGQPRGRKRALVAVAILLAAFEHQVDNVTPTLRKCATQLSSVAPACKRALLAAYRTGKKHQKALALVDAVLASDRELRFETRMQLLFRLARFGQMRKLARERLATDAAAEAPTRWLALADQERGDLRAALTGFEKLRAGSNARANDHNMAAWISLFLDPTDARSLQAARKAVMATKRHRVAMLNTLAAVHAARGELSDAYRVMLECLRVASAKKPGRSDWLVFGKIAEGYGFAKEARHAYQQASKKDKAKEPPSTVSTRSLAKLWQRKIGK